MRGFGKFLQICVALVSLVSVQALAEADQSDPYKMVTMVGGNTFERMKNEQPAIQENPELLRVIMEKELLPYVDYKFSAAKVLGKYFSKLPREKKIEYIKVFREYLITTYAVAMGYYDGQTVEFMPAKPFANKKTVTVRAVVKEIGGRPDINVQFKVRKSKKTNQWKAYDMVAEGISMLSSKQSEFQSLMRKKGIDHLIATMEEKIKAPIVLSKI